MVSSRGSVLINKYESALISVDDSSYPNDADRSNPSLSGPRDILLTDLRDTITLTYALAPVNSKLPSSTTMLVSSLYDDADHTTSGITPTAVKDHDSESSVECDEDPEDIFSSSLFSLFAELAPNLSSKGLFRYRGLKVSFPQTNHWELQAHGIWRSSLHMVDHMENTFSVLAEPRDREALVRCADGDVLELGASSGLPGLHLARTFAPKSVTLSDYPDPFILDTLKKNVELNRSQIPATTAISVLGHKWGDVDDTREESLLLHSYDIIIAADTLWLSDQHDSFAQSLAMYLRPSPESFVYLVAGLHTGRFPIENFLSSAKRVGLEVRSISEARIMVEVDSSDVPINRREWAPERSGETNAERSLWLVEIILVFQHPSVTSTVVVQPEELDQAFL